MFEDSDEESPRARGFTLGGVDGAALGGGYGGALGPQREDGYRARLTTRDGRRRDISALPDYSLELQHTGVSDIQLTIPRIDGLSDFKFGSLDFFWGDKLLFSAHIGDVPAFTRGGETATLGGLGPGWTLQRGYVSVDYAGLAWSTAIDTFWTEETRFAATTHAPASEGTVPSGDDGTFEGTPLEVASDLHERANMRFTIQQTSPDPQVESYRPGELVRTLDAEVVDRGDPNEQVYGYANVIKVVGAVDSSTGQRYSATVKDQPAIDTLGYETRPWPVGPDPTLTSDAACQARGERVLQERLDADSLSGTIGVIPSLVLPGYHYQLPDDVWGGATVPIESVSMSESPGEALAELRINPPSGPIDALAGVQRETTDIKKLL